MAHFAQWRAGGFSIDMNVGAGAIESLLDAESADALDGVDRYAREIGDRVRERGRNCGRRVDRTTDVVIVDRFDDWISDAAVIRAARDHNGQLLREGAEGFGEEGIFFAV